MSRRARTCLSELRRTGALTAKETAAARPHIACSVADRRGRPREPLPDAESLLLPPH